MTAQDQTNEGSNDGAKDGDNNDESLLFQQLYDGFCSIRQRRGGKLPPGTKLFVSSEACKKISKAKVLINFVDPSSMINSIKDPSATAAGKAPTKPLYDRLLAIFQRDYDCVLRQLSYQDVRSKAQNIIESIQVDCMLTQSAILMDSTPNDDATTWHVGPFCHVYLATCSSFEEYRTKVKPSVQAFVSQIEATHKDASFLVVYCPTGGKSGEEGGNGPARARGGAAAWANRIRRIGNNAAAGAPNAVSVATNADSSLHSGSTEVTSDSGDFVEDGAAGAVSSATANFSKVEKELLKRFTADFSTGPGQVCALSTLVDPVDDEQENASSDDSPLQKLEWSHFIKSLSQSVVRGFQARCRRYDEALRAMDSQRAKDAANSKNANYGKPKFNLRLFFLAKESLAFSYKQMNLPAEALLQYKELRAFLPDIRTQDIQSQVLANEKDSGDALSGIEGTETRSLKEESAAWEALSALVAVGDMAGFRKAVRETKDLSLVAPAMEEYLFFREVSILFQLGDPVEVVRRSLSFCTTMFDFRSSRLREAMSDEERLQRSIDMERWAFSFCWDVKRAADIYLGITQKTAHRTSLTAANMDGEGNPTARVLTFARHLCDILGFARLRLIRLADLVLAQENPIHLGADFVPTDLGKAWEPWSKPMDVVEPQASADELAVTHDESFLEDALKSGEAFQSKFLEVMKVAASLNTFAGRKRSAARLRLDAVEIYTRRGDMDQAVEALKAIAAVYGRDQWWACNFLLMFRLAGFQRSLSSPSDYITTLVQCFSEFTSDVAPPRAVEALQTDLKAIADSGLVNGAVFTDAPLFGATLGVEDQLPVTGPSDRNLVRKLYHVGDKASVSLLIDSYLPRELADVKVVVDLVPYQTYVSSMEDSIAIKKADVTKSLSLDAAVKLSVGSNEFNFDWIPMVSGQFVIAKIKIEWKGIQFDYLADKLKKPTIRIDVLPGDPTQSMAVLPTFIVPGHYQPLRIEFNSGSDVIERGEVKIECSPGLLLLPPGDKSDSDKWLSSCKTLLPACPPGEQVVLTATIRSNGDAEPEYDPPNVNVMITTSYRYLPPNGEKKEESSSSCSENVLEMVVPALERPAVTVENVLLSVFAIGEAFLSVTLKCHTLMPFLVKRWSLELPAYLALHQDGDMNASLTDTSIIEGDLIHFGFQCSHSVTDWKSGAATLVVEVEDEYGTVFNERLDLRIRRSIIPKIELPDLKNVPVELKTTAAEGPVGAPVDLAYIVDTSVFAGWKGGVFYSIEMESPDWFVSGNSEGLVDCTGGSFRLELVAIPVQPGVRLDFPKLSLTLNDERLESPFPLSISTAEVNPFRAFSPPAHSTIAFPARLEI